MVIDTAWGHLQTRFSEWWMGGYMFVWGLYLAIHPGMFDQPEWRGLQAAAPQSIWATVAAVSGFARLGALYVNGRHFHTPTIRLITSFVSLFIWTQVWIGCLKAPTDNIGVIGYSMLMLADIYSAYRASADVTLVSRSRKSELDRGAQSS